MKAAYLIAIAFTLVVMSCSSKSKTKESAIEEKEKLPLSQLLGSYVGSFGDNKITLLITRANNDSIGGRSIVGGYDRPFTGIITSTDDGYAVTAKEPGDDPHDGEFKFVMQSHLPDQVKGSWKPFKANDPIGPKEYTLQRKAFSYITSSGEYPQSSQRLLIEEDVNNLAKEELEFMRNEIFARHGYCFKKKALREAFENEEWYIPHTIDVVKDLTTIERKNISLIKKYEKYAEDFGDDFGR